MMSWLYITFLMGPVADSLVDVMLRLLIECGVVVIFMSCCINLNGK